MTDLNPSKILQPGKQAFDFPTSFVSSQDTTVLGSRLLAVGFMGCDHLNSLFVQTLIQRVTVVGSVTDQPFGLFFDKPLFQGTFHQLHFMRRSTSNGYGDRKTS